MLVLPILSRGKQSLHNGLVNNVMPDLEFLYHTCCKSVFCIVHKVHKIFVRNLYWGMILFNNSIIG